MLLDITRSGVGIMSRCLGFRLKPYHLDLHTRKVSLTVLSTDETKISNPGLRQFWVFWSKPLVAAMVSIGLSHLGCPPLTDYILGPGTIPNSH